MSNLFVLPQAAALRGHFAAGMQNKSMLSVDQLTGLFVDSVFAMTIQNIDAEPLSVEPFVSSESRNSALHRAVSVYFSGKAAESLDKFIDTILRSACQLLDLIQTNHDTVPLYSPGEDPHNIRFPTSRCHSLISHAFLLNIALDPVTEKKRHPGGLVLRNLFQQPAHESGVGIEKILCLIEYLNHESHAKELNDLTHQNQAPDIIFCKPFLRDDEFPIDMLYDPGEDCVEIHDEPMERRDAHAFVNFANRNFGYGCFIDSCTQEEILQMCCPEMNIGMLHYGLMDDDCVVLTHNARRFSAYTGYLHSFRFAGPFVNNDVCSNLLVQTIITMDAVSMGHFNPANVRRDTKKAFLAFKKTAEFWINQYGGENNDSELKQIVISTGRWGCGVFGGTVLHKFLQQYIAARLVNEAFDQDNKMKGGRVKLLFSSFRDKKTLLELERISTQLKAMPLPARTLYDAVLCTGDAQEDAKAFKSVDTLLERIIAVQQHRDVPAAP